MGLFEAIAGSVLKSTAQHLARETRHELAIRVLDGLTSDEPSRAPLFRLEDVVGNVLTGEHHARSLDVAKGVCEVLLATSGGLFGARVVLVYRGRTEGGFDRSPLGSYVWRPVR